MKHIRTATRAQLYEILYNDAHAGLAAKIACKSELVRRDRKQISGKVRDRGA